jgi:hypothetical protein
MPSWLLQAAAIVIGLAALCFFAFTSAYYARNRRLALALRDEDRAAAGGVAGGAGLDRATGADSCGAVGGCSPPGGE